MQPIKLFFRDEVRRFSVPRGTNAVGLAKTVSGLVASLSADGFGTTWCLKYQDEEHDLVGIANDADLVEAFRVAQTVEEQALLRLYVFPLTHAPLPPASEAAAAADTVPATADASVDELTALLKQQLGAAGDDVELDDLSPEMKHALLSSLTVAPAPSAGEKWKCSNCAIKVLNKADAMKCLMCGTKRPSAAASAAAAGPAVASAESRPMNSLLKMLNASPAGESAALHGSKQDQTVQELMARALDGNVSAVRDILQRGGLSPNVCDVSGDSLLMNASYWGHEGLVAFLITAKADPNQQSWRTGYTALMRAAKASRAACVRLLVHRGADPVVHNFLGENAFDLAGAFDKGQAENVRRVLTTEFRDSVRPLLMTHTALTSPPPEHDQWTGACMAAGSLPGLVLDYLVPPLDSESQRVIDLEMKRARNVATVRQMELEKDMQRDLQEIQRIQSSDAHTAQQRQQSDQVTRAEFERLLAAQQQALWTTARHAVTARAGL